MVQHQTLPSDPPPGADCVPTSNSFQTTSDIMTPMMTEAPCDLSPFHPQYQNNVSPSMIDGNSSLIGNTVGYIPESFNGILTSSSYSPKETLDNTPEPGHAVTNPFTYSVIDSQSESQIHESIDNAPQQSLDTIGYQQVENKYHKTANPRTRNDSTDSVDTLDSSSSGEIFNSAYTDTVSSTTSSTCFMKTSPDSDEESQEGNTMGQAACCNDGYMSYSSSEVLNDYDEDGSQEDLLSLNNEKTDSKPETSPLLVVEDLISLKNEENHLETETSEMLPQNVNDEILIIVDSADQGVNEFVHHTLSPIQENEIVSFAVEEVEPTHYTKITDNLIVADESFLFNSVSNLGDLELGNNGKRAGTMHNLFERSSFLDLTEISRVGRVCQKALVYLKDDMTLGSLASLNTIVAKEKEASKDPMQSVSLISSGKSQGVLKKSNYMKNLIALSVTITLLYIAIGSVRNLQSSINHEGGVGVIGLAVNFVGYVVGSMFSSSIVQSFHPRRCIIANLFPNLLYIAANLYPTMWIMVPISLIQGISLAIVSNATSTYITFLAKGCSEKTKKSFAQVSGGYFGIYMLLYQSYIIVGNLIASLILEPPAETSNASPLAGIMNSTANNATQVVNSTMNASSIISSNLTQINGEPTHLHLCGAGFCQHFDFGVSTFSVAIETKFLLFGVYIGCILLAVLNAVFFLEPLNKSLFTSTVSPIKKFKSQMSSLARFFVNVKFLLLLPLLMYSAMQFAFVSAEFIKGYVTCPLGLHMIGYTMICFGICSSVGSYLSGLLNRYIGRIPFIFLAAVLNFGSLVYMLFWQPTPGSLIPYFLIMGLWGTTDGIWNTQTNSLMGIIFPENYEEAYAGLRITQGLSVAAAFGYSNVLCMTAKIYITLAMCVLGIVGYLIMEGIHRCDQTKVILMKPKQTTV